MIPKIIHYCWLSGDPFPDLVNRCIVSWRTKLPDYEIRLWNDKSLDINSNIWLKQSIKEKKYAFAADYIRLFALYNYGGIYLDSDVEIIGSFDSFLEHNLFIGFDYNNDLEPAIVGAIPEQQWIKKILDYYQNRTFIKEDGKFDIRPLPMIFDEIANQIFSYKRNGKFQILKDQGISIYPYDYFSPKNVYFNKFKRTENTVSIHHFDGSWIERNRQYRIKRLIHQILLLIFGKRVHDKMIFHYRKY